MAIEIQSKLSRENIAFLFLSITGLILIYFIGIYPLRAETTELQKKISELQIKTAEQQKIQSMLAIVDQEKKNITTNKGFPGIAVTPLPQEETDRILPDFEKIAAKSKMEILEVTPQLKKAADLKRLVITTKLHGDFKNVRSFLYDLLTLTYVTQINKIEIQTSGKRIECNLTYSVNLS